MPAVNHDKDARTEAVFRSARDIPSPVGRSGSARSGPSRPPVGLSIGVIHRDFNPSGAIRVSAIYVYVPAPAILTNKYGDKRSRGSAD